MKYQAKRSEACCKSVQEGSDVHPEQNDNFMLVRYMPSGKFLLTLSQDRGDVKLWDVPGLNSALTFHSPTAPLGSKRFSVDLFRSWCPRRLEL